MGSGKPPARHRPITDVLAQPRESTRPREMDLAFLNPPPPPSAGAPEGCVAEGGGVMPLGRSSRRQPKLGLGRGKAVG